MIALRSSLFRFARGFWLALLLGPLLLWAGDSTVVFNEIHYHPAGAGTDTVEWIELHNQMAVDMELSGWRLAAGVEFAFPTGTILPGRGYLVVAADPTAFAAASGLAAVFGPWTGRLANEGERIELRNHNGRLMDEVRYGNEEPWPVTPRGSGATLAKRAPQLGSAPASSWGGSRRVGGTPGTMNFLQGGLELPALRFSEIGAGADAAFQVELANRGNAPVSLDGFVLAGVGNRVGQFVFPPGQSLSPNEFRSIDAIALGWRPAEGDRLFLFAAGGAEVWDGVSVNRRPKARREGEERWLHPSGTTPGATNVFDLQEAVVINEILYHAPDLPGSPAAARETIIVPIDGEWRVEGSGRDLGAGWREPSFDDADWSRGRGAFFVETSELPAPKNTPLTLGRTTYYFRTHFAFDGRSEGSELLFQPLVDDGAVFYLNGTEIHRWNMPEGPVSYGTFASPSVTDAAFSETFRVPADKLRAGVNVVAVEVHQSSADSSDVVFGLIATLREELAPAVPKRESGEAWVELFNRGAESVDLTGWRFDDGIRYAFPPGTVLGPGEYLVVAQQAEAMRARHPGARIFGEFQGRLSARNDRLLLLDANGNPADEVEYHDRKPWPSLADAGGSSLELRDPRADNARAEAWMASDETGRTRWKDYSYTAVARADGGPVRWNEFVAGLLEDGEVLLDDISVVESPDTATARELLQDGAFNDGGASWRFLGTHRLSRVEPDPDNPANAVLRLIATGPTEHMHNHLETTLAGNRSIANGRTYRVSFRARPMGGTPRLNTRLYFSRASRTTVLETPDLFGTPGARNSRFIENAGPTFARLRHAPVAPGPGEGVRVNVEAADPDGVAECRLWWNPDAAGWRSARMEADAGRGFVGSIPGFGAATAVQFYVEAKDSRGAGAFFPPGGPESRAMYQVRDGLVTSGALHSVRIVMTAADAAFQFATTNLMSNEWLGGTVIYDESEVFYDAGVRLQASQRGRPDPGRVGFTLSFPADRLFRGAHDSITLDRSGGYSGRGGRQDEIVIRHIINQAGGMPDLYNDLAQVVFPRPLEGQRRSVAQLLMAKYGDDFLDDSFANGSDGAMFKLELVYYPTTSLSNDPRLPKLPLPDEVLGSDIQDRGDDPENYRWYFLNENRRSEDDFGPIMRLAKGMSLSGAALEQQSRALMDVEQWARVFAAKSLSGDVDTYGFGFPHNHIIYFRPDDGRALGFPWDLDFSWRRAATDPLVPSGNIGRVLGFPAHLRLFYGHLLDILNRSYNANYMGRWITHYGQLAGQNYSGIQTYITQRGAWALGQLPARRPFLIATGGGQPFLTNAATLTLRGSAWIDARRVEVRGLEGASVTNLIWTSVTNWQASVPLLLGPNRIEALGFGFDGQLIASNAVAVVSSAAGGGADADGDAMPDVWEIARQLDPNKPDAAEDPDQDGLSNLQEYWAGTDPRLAASRLMLLVQAAAEGVALGFFARPGRNYALEARNGFGPGDWTRLAAIPARMEEGVVTFTDVEAASGQPARFYRLILLRPEGVVEN